MEPRRWTSRFVYRKPCVKTTWTFRLMVAVCGLALILPTRGFWMPALANSLVCNESVRAADAILVENFDPDYLLFERAETLYRQGLAPRVLVPVAATADGRESGVEKGIAELMSRIARLNDVQLIPVKETEPISLSTAFQIRDLLERESVRSIVLVTPGFRSRRSSLVNGAVLGAAGISVACVPVFGTSTPQSWTATWHGIQSVALQFLKLQYYRLYVLPRLWLQEGRPSR